MKGTIRDLDEPVTWIREYNNSRVLYSALGHPDDFKQPQFRRMLVNAVYWALELPIGE